MSTKSNASKINDEVLQDWLSDIENEDYSDFEDASQMTYGLIEPEEFKGDLVNFRIPKTLSASLNNVAAQHSCTRNDVIKAYVIEGLRKELA